jgi:hypothetical protein
MKRVIAVVACGVSLSACGGSSWMPSFELPSMSMPSMPSFGGGGGSSATLAVESDPPGADASAGGTSCRTPCRLTVPASGPFTVNIALNGYVPQSVPVRVMQADDPRLGSEDSAGGGSARLDPNPVYVELERAPPPPPAPRKKKAEPKHAPTVSRRTAPNTASQPPPANAPSAPTTAVAPNAPPQQPQSPQQPNNGAAPWPMPR